MKSFISVISLVLVSYSLGTNHLYTMPTADQPPVAQPMAIAPNTIPPAMPVPATMPTAIPQAPPPQVPAAMPLAPTAGIPTQTNNQPQELTQIDPILEEIQNTKKAIKDQIKQLDDKLAEARNEVATMRKNSSDILAKAQETEAQALLNTINASTAKITATQSFIDGDFSRTFDGNIAKIQAAIQKGQSLIKSLQEKGYQQQIAQAQIKAMEDNAKPAAEAEAAAKSIAKKQQTQGFTWDSVTKFFAKVVRRIKRVFEAEPELAKGTQPKKNEAPIDVAEKKKIVEPIIATTPPSITPTISPITQGLITSQLNSAETTMKKLDEQQRAIGEKLLSLEKSTTTLVDTLKGVQPAEKLTEKAKEPQWKRIAMLITSEILDGIAFIVSGIKYIVTSIYDYFFSGMVNRVVSDVKEKIKEDDKQQ